MFSPLELQRMAFRIENLLRISTHGWVGGDDLEFRNCLPGGHDRRVLPEPKRLRDAAQDNKGESPTQAEFQAWNQTILRLESLAHDNDPRNPKRMLRDMARGRFPR